MTRYKCIAGHKSFLNPTTQNKSWCRLKDMDCKDKKRKTNTNENGNCRNIKKPSLPARNVKIKDTDNVSVGSRPLELLELQLRTNREKIDKLRLQINSLSSDLLKVTNKKNEKIGMLEDTILDRDVALSKKEEECTLLQDKINSLRKDQEEECTLLQDKINSLRKDKEKMRSRIRVLKKQLEKHDKNKPTSLYDGLTRAFTTVVDTYYSRCSPKTIGKEVAWACWDFKAGVAQFFTMRHAREYLKKYVFTPQNILSALDYNGGVCNLKAYDVIRSVEIKAKDPLKE